MRGVLVWAALLISMGPAGAGEGFWGPSHRAPDMVFHHAPERHPGTGRLPLALLHGPEGPVSMPYVDRQAHRARGGQVRSYPRPLHAGARLDWCLTPQGGCGPVVAQAFCAHRGYRRVVEAIDEEGVGRYTVTRQLGSHLVCRGPGCRGFHRITCAGRDS